MADPRPIFYKSDTQGYDETIISALPTDFWDRVYGGIFEIRKIKGKSFSKDKILAMLANTSSKCRRDRKRNYTKDIIEIIEDDKRCRDYDICFELTQQSLLIMISIKRNIRKTQFSKPKVIEVVTIYTSHHDVA